MSGVKRKIDKLGRLVLPKSYREALGLSENSEVTVSLDGGIITVIPIEDRCVLCGSLNDLNHSISLCKYCIDKIKNTT